MKDIFRKKYGTLSEQQKEQGEAIKTKAEELLDLYMDASESNTKPEDEERSRCIQEAINFLEASVMWACKGVYTVEEQLK